MTPSTALLQVLNKLANVLRVAQINENAPTGWSQSGRLQTYNRNNAVTLQQQFPTAGNYTVQFGVIKDDADVVRPEALISWNVKGNQVERRITVGDGTSITGQAEAVSIKVFDSLVPGMSGTPGQDYTVSIQVTKGVRANPGQQAPIFQPSEAENPLGTAVVVNAALSVATGTACSFDVPEGATQVIAGVLSGPVPTVLDNSDIIMSASNPSGAIITWFPLPATWMPLPPTATRVNVANRSGQIVDVMVLFGIDG